MHRHPPPTSPSPFCGPRSEAASLDYPEYKGTRYALRSYGARNEEEELPLLSHSKDITMRRPQARRKKDEASSVAAVEKKAPDRPQAENVLLHMEGMH